MQHVHMRWVMVLNQQRYMRFCVSAAALPPRSRTAMPAYNTAGFGPPCASYTALGTYLRPCACCCCAATFRGLYLAHTVSPYLEWCAGLLPLLCLFCMPHSATRLALECHHSYRTVSSAHTLRARFMGFWFDTRVMLNCCYTPSLEHTTIPSASLPCRHVLGSPSARVYALYTASLSPFLYSFAWVSRLHYGAAYIYGTLY